MKLELAEAVEFQVESVVFGVGKKMTSEQGACCTCCGLLLVVIAIVLGLISHFNQTVITLTIDGKLDQIRSMPYNGDEVDSNYATPLMIASKLGHADIVNYFLQLQKNVSWVDRDGNNALHYAAQCDQNSCETVLNLLLQHTNISIHSRNKFNDTTIMLAAKHGNVNIISPLISRGANINDSNDQWSVLTYACSSRNFRLIFYLLENNANLNFFPTAGFHCIQRYFESYAQWSAHEHTKVKEAYIASGLFWGATTESILHIPYTYVASNVTSFLSLMHKYNADISQETCPTSLYLFIKSEPFVIGYNMEFSNSTFNSLIKFGAQLNNICNSEPLLHFAAKACRLTIIDMLIGKNINTALVDDKNHEYEYHIYNNCESLIPIWNKLKQK